MWWLGFTLNWVLLCYLAMVMGKHRINNYKKCSQINDNLDDCAAGGIRRDAHCLMEHIFGFMQSY